MLPLITVFNCSNLPEIELIFRLPTINLFILLSLIAFSMLTASSGSTLFIKAVELSFNSEANDIDSPTLLSTFIRLSASLLVIETFKGYSIAEEKEALLRLPMQALFRQSKILHIKDNKLKVSIPVPVVLRCRPLLFKCLDLSMFS